MTELDIKTIIALIPYVKYEEDIKEEDKLVYVTSHYDEILATIPLEILMEVNKMVYESDEPAETTKRSTNKMSKPARVSKKKQMDLMKKWRSIG